LHAEAEKLGENKAQTDKNEFEKPAKKQE